MALTLVGNKICPYAQRVAFCLEEAGVGYQLRYIDPYRERPQWFIEIAPAGKVPVLQDGPLVLCESDVILEYLNDLHGGRYLPSDPAEAALLRLQLRALASVHGGLNRMFEAHDERAFHDAVADVRAALSGFERYLARVVGRERAQPTLISFSFAPVLHVLSWMERICATEILQSALLVAEWAQELCARPSFVRTVHEDYQAELMGFLMRNGTFVSCAARRVSQLSAAAAGPAGSR